jgi:glutamyl-tRNA synthetase/glutamyl-Q tRNA(Asp) synthetase
MSLLRPDLSVAAARVPRPVVTRFAPSPTGYLHLGHVVNAIYVWGLARALGGSVILRIEDHDQSRSRPEYEASILADLAWLGFVKPRPAEHPTPAPVRQSDRTRLYEDALARLKAAHHVYACECSRTAIAGERYPGRCRTRNLPDGPGRGLRVAVGPGDEAFDDLLLGRLRQTPADQCGDLLVRDRHGHWTYHFAVTVDDLWQDVTLIVRGADLVSSTGRQRRLARLLQEAGLRPGAPAPAYVHHPLLLGEDGHKLSKSAGAAGVRNLRGISPAQVIGRAAAAVGLTDTVAIPAEDVPGLFRAAALSPAEYGVRPAPSEPL